MVSGGSKDAVVKRLEGPAGRGSTEPQRYSTLLEMDRSRGRGGGEIRGVASGLDGLRQPPSGMSSFSIAELNSSPSDCPRTSSERTPPPPLTQGSTATVLARYWSPPDGQPGRQIIKTEGIYYVPYFCFFLHPEGGPKKPLKLFLFLLLESVLLGSKIPKVFLIRSRAQQNCAYTFLVTLSTDLPSQTIHLFSN